MDRSNERSEVRSALWGGSITRRIFITKTLTDEERGAMEKWLIAETKMFLLKGAFVHLPDGSVYSTVSLPHPEWTPVELGDKLVGWWENKQGNIVGPVVRESWDDDSPTSEVGQKEDKNP